MPGLFRFDYYVINGFRLQTGEVVSDDVKSVDVNRDVIVGFVNQSQLDFVDVVMEIEVDGN